MIHASFDAERTREAAIGGAVQYDTGQRIRMHGLPSPEALAQEDEFLSGENVTVQAQFGFAGDSQSEPRLAQYDEETGTWLADVPDVYLTRSETVNVYVYVMYGADGEKSRAKTMYKGSFTPLGRPAPNTAVTPDQRSAWDVLVAEVNLALSAMNTAVSAANAAVAGVGEAVQEAQEAAQAASQAVGDAQRMLASWENASASTQTLEPGTNANVTLTKTQDGSRHFAFSIPRGAKGEKGDTGPAGVTFRLSGTTLYITTD